MMWEKELGTGLSYLLRIKAGEVLRSSEGELNRLFRLDFPFEGFTWYDLQIFCPPLSNLKFLVYHVGHDEWVSGELYETLDLDIHDFLYYSKLYVHDTEREFMPRFAAERMNDRFDMWTYAFRQRNIPLLNWVMERGYRPPPQILSSQVPDGEFIDQDFIEWIWRVFLNKQLNRLLEMTFVPDHDEAWHVVGDWAFGLYRARTSKTSDEVNAERLKMAVRLSMTFFPWKTVYDVTCFSPEDLAS